MKNQNAWRKTECRFSGRTLSKFVVHPASIKLLTDATWDFAHHILWCGYPFARREITLAKYRIRKYYEQISPELFTEKAPEYFTACCERILAAREYIRLFYHKNILHPCFWIPEQQNSFGKKQFNNKSIHEHYKR